MGAMKKDLPRRGFRVITSVDGRITSSIYLFIIKVDARSVAGLSVSVAGDE